MRVPILIADDHQSVTEALKALLSERTEISVVGTVARLEELPAALKRRAPEVLLLDVRMGDDNALDLLPQLRSEFPQLKVIVLSMYSDEAYVFRALQQGADAYLLKQSPSAQLIDAIHAVMRGERYLGEGLSEERLEQYQRHAHAFSDDPLDLLTPRERQVAKRVAQGQSSEQIADDLGIGRRTVESHRANLLRKLGLSTPIQLARRILRKR